MMNKNLKKKSQCLHSSGKLELKLQSALLCTHRIAKLEGVTVKCQQQ